MFTLLLLVGLSARVEAQEGRKIRIVNANSLEFNERIPGARRLIGEVIFEHEGTLLYCDSAYFFESTDRMEAYSNVRIVGDSVTVTANRLNYDGITRLAELVGNVRMRDANSTLTTDKLNYDLKNKVATYTTGGRIVSNRDKNELQSVFGQYQTAKRTFYFRKNVKLTNPEYVMTCDTLHYHTPTDVAYFFGPTRIVSDENTILCENGFYNTRSDYSEFGKNARILSKGRTVTGDFLSYDRKKALGIARNHVSISDSANQVTLTGDDARYLEKTEVMVVTRHAAMEKVFGKDTLFLAGDTLRSVTDTVTNLRTLFAYRHVRFYKPDFQGKCDSLVYAERDSMMRFYGRPVLWNEENQLLGDSVSLQLANDELKTLYLKNAAFVISREDSLHFNQIKGKNITGHFVNSALRRVDVKGNGLSVYYAKDTDSKYIGVNQAECSDMVIYLDSSEVERISFLKQPKASLVPVNKLKPKELMLKGFRWYGTLRPKRKEDIYIQPEEPKP